MNGDDDDFEDWDERDEQEPERDDLENESQPGDKRAENLNPWDLHRWAHRDPYGGGREEDNDRCADDFSDEPEEDFPAPAHQRSTDDPAESDGGDHPVQSEDVPRLDKASDKASAAAEPGPYSKGRLRNVMSRAFFAKFGGGPLDLLDDEELDVSLRVCRGTVAVLRAVNLGPPVEYDSWAVPHYRMLDVAGWLQHRCNRETVRRVHKALRFAHGQQPNTLQAL